MIVFFNKINFTGQKQISTYLTENKMSNTISKWAILNKMLGFTSKSGVWLMSHLYSENCHIGLLKLFSNLYSALQNSEKSG